jgi:hypothetical protein
VIKPTLEHGFDYKKLLWSGKLSERDILRNKESHEEEIADNKEAE